MLKRIKLANNGDTNRVEDNFHGNTSTPKMKDLNKKRNDESFQFSDESWMENIQLDEHEICKSNVINECIEENKELIIHRKLRFSSLTPKKRINDSFEETELATVNQNVDDFLIGNESHSQNCDDENNISEQNGNFQINVSSLIKEKLKQNAKISAQKRISNTSLIQETAIAVALEEAEKRRNEHSQINSKGAFYGLPSQVKQLLKKHRGIEELYEWQHECLTLPAITEGKNLIYCLPTSGGKTLVAEILILQKLLCKKQNALLILPYISIVQEKVRTLSPLAIELDFLIEEYGGNKGKIPPRQRRKRHSLYIATIEKAHLLINCFLDCKRTEELGLVVVDELHMIGDGQRGAVLESVLTKVIYSFKQTQVIGMSATIGNINELQTFLRADSYCGNFRPVQLKEYIKIGDEIWEFNPDCDISSCFQYSRKITFSYTPEMQRKDPDLLAGLVLEVIPENSCLLFCPTKNHCENVAKLLSNLLSNDLKEYKSEEKQALLKALANESSGSVCSVLSQTLPYGVAYHHSGLTMDERKLLEEGFLSGTLCCLVCTSTLASGVNLPAKRVILRAPYVGSEFISLSRYKQMVGRAGRAGMDNAGESILIIKPEEKLKVQELLTSPLEICRSSLMYDEGKGLRMLLLSLIGLEIAVSPDDLKGFVKCTLLAIQTEDQINTSNSIVHDSLMSLKEKGLIKSKEKNGIEFLEVTRLGRATFKGGIQLEEANHVYSELTLAQKSLALHSHLHLLHLVTPTKRALISVIPDIYFSIFMALNNDDLHTAELIGITESSVVQLASGFAFRSVKQSIMNRFYCTLILYDMWQQKTIWEVAEKYRLHRGIVQNLLTNSVSYANSVFHFCQELEELWPYQQIFPCFVQQLSHCVTAELIPLMELPSVKRGRARQFYNAGYKTLADIAKANPSELVAKIDHLQRRTASQIVSAAKMLIFEKAESLTEEAEDMMANL